MLGTSAAAVGVVIGFGELVGYGLRFLTGWLADRTGRYWLFIMAGYSVNLLVVPLIGLAILFISALISLAVLAAARLNYPHFSQFEKQVSSNSFQGFLSHSFRFYLIGIAFLALGIADFPLLAIPFLWKAMGKTTQAKTTP